MAKVKISPEKVEELKQKHNLTDEAIKDFSASLEVEVDEQPTTVPSSSPDELNLSDINKSLTSGEITFTQYLMWSEMQERKADNKRQAKIDQERLDLMREERKPQTPAWAEGLITKVNSLEAKVNTSAAVPSAKSDDPLLRLYEERSKDLMVKLERQDEKYEKLLEELKADREKAKDAETKALIENKIGDLEGRIGLVQELIEKLNQTPKDPIEFLVEAKRRAEALGIELNFGGGGNSTAKSREELQVKTADTVINEIRAATKEGREFLKEFGDTVVLPRMRVETGMAKTSPMSSAERVKYYKDLGIPQ